MADIELSPIRPDFEGIRQQLQAQLAARESWRDILTAGTGQTLIDMIAAAAAFSQMGIQRAVQETSLDTARLSSSIYTLMRTLGVHINRKIPAGVSVNLVRNVNLSTLLSIPAYTKFLVDGKAFFNRENILFNTDENTRDVMLYQGDIKRTTKIGTGDPFQSFVLGNANFAISDLDLFALINNQKWDRVTNGLWHYFPYSTVFYENTTPDGNVEIRFGNNIYGKIPAINAHMEFVWVETNGIDGNNVAVGLDVQCTTSNLQDVTGTTLSTIYGGQNSPGAKFYQVIGPSIYAARNNAVTRDDYRAIALQYGDLYDVVFLAQAELGRFEVTWMNAIQYTVLPKTNWDNAKHEDFLKYLRDYAMFGMNFVRFDAQQVTDEIIIDAYSYPQVDLQVMQDLIQQIIYDKFTTPTVGTLGKSVFVSEITNAVMQEVQRELGFNMLDYVVLRQPRIDIELKRTQYFQPSNITVNSYYSQRIIGTRVDF